MVGIRGQSAGQGAGQGAGRRAHGRQRRSGTPDRYAAAMPARHLFLLPDLGDLLRTQPQYNAATVTELLAALGEREVWWATSPDPEHPLRDALPAAGITVRDLPLPDWTGTDANGANSNGADSNGADADHEQLLSFLRRYPQGRERLQAAAQAEAVFAARLGEPLTPAAVFGPLLTAAREYHAATAAALGEGPGTRWHARRLDEVAALAAELSGVLLAPLDDLPGLLDRLPGAALPESPGFSLPDFSPGEASRLRALADRAWSLREEDDPAALLAALERESGDRVTPRAELDAAAANLYFAAGDLPAARFWLERAAHALPPEHPRSLAGLVLARLGQVRDALGERDLARRTYQAVLALNFAPAVAREVAAAGLETPFVLDLTAPEAPWKFDT